MGVAVVVISYHSLLLVVVVVTGVDPSVIACDRVGLDVAIEDDRLRA